MCIGLTDNIALNFHIHHDEVCTIERIGHDAADECGSKNYGVGAFLVKKTFDGNLIGQIKFLVTASY